jgi:CYTH domain-containing protein
MSGPAGKYARFELERRFLVDHLPERKAQDQGWRITDRYINKTRLRLRRMEPLAGGEAVLKLGQKEVPSPPDFSRMTITNIYLSPDEYEVFAVLPARELRKTRYSLEDAGCTYGVDVFDGPLAGLILAEVGFETIGRMNEQWHLPPWVLREVSDDLRFTGGVLAGLAQDEATTLIRQISVKP